MPASLKFRFGPAFFGCLPTWAPERQSCRGHLSLVPYSSTPKKRKSFGISAPSSSVLARVQEQLSILYFSLLVFDRCCLRAMYVVVRLLSTSPSCVCVFVVHACIFCSEHFCTVEPNCQHVFIYDLSHVVAAVLRRNNDRHGTGCTSTRGCGNPWS